MQRDVGVATGNSVHILRVPDVSSCTVVSYGADITVVANSHYCDLGQKNQVIVIGTAEAMVLRVVGSGVISLSFHSEGKTTVHLGGGVRLKGNTFRAVGPPPTGQAVIRSLR